MSTKRQTLIDSLNKDTYTKHEVVNILGKLGVEKSTPKTLKVGDVFIDFVGVKKRPLVIVKVISSLGLCVGFPLSRTESPMNLCAYSSRFHDDGFIQNQLITTPIEIALEYFVGVFDNNQAINMALKKHKEFYSNL